MALDREDDLLFIQADYEGYPASVEILKSRFLDHPRAVSIETLVKCNSRCSFCPYPTSPRQGQVLPEELFHKIIAELSELPPTHTFMMTLHRINEPLLDRRMKYFCGVVAEKIPSAIQQFWTNGTMLKEGEFEWMTQYQSAELTVSLNSMNEEEHLRMMGFGIEGVLQGLDYLHQLAESGRFTLPVTLCAPFIDERQSRSYGVRCRRRWPLFRPAIRPFFQWMGGMQVGTEYRDAAALPGAEENQVAGSPCGQWFDLHILANGYVTRCCIDENGNGGKVIYDVRHNHVLDIYRRARRLSLRERLPARATVRGCKGCFHLG